MKFSFSKTFLLGFGFFGVSVIWMVYNAFVPLFLANRFHIEPWLIGLFMTFDNIAALFIQPPVGAWSDRLRTPIGRRMPFILIGAPIGAIAFGFIPLAAVLPLFVACTSTLLLSMAFWRTPVVALMPDITPSAYRSQANGIINFMGGVGAIIATLGGGALYKLNPAYPFWMGSILVIVATLLLFLFIREPREYEITSSERPALFRSLKEVVKDPDKSAFRILLAIFFWFVAYNAIEAFFTLYAQNHLGLPGGDGARLLGQLSLIFVLFALPAGYIGGSWGRRRTIITGILLLSACMLLMFLLPAPTLLIQVTRLPVLGVVPIIGVILMIAGASWALINVNSLPMVVDMTDNLRVGTYTGLYYLFSTLAAIVGPNINGWIIQLTGKDYNRVMLVGPIFMFIALLMMIGVRRGEVQGD
ncbi:MAG TPA: MFS transporter [Anaerolinea thermolimosa]|uniref:MFS transporter n=1 Tax=Anaerolinea thermolimosa TaxID=229919 RepID=A0A3D1JCX1_9CHLR|nr:SLC45 family MFS transporter [Anaerolinea thermolimosa]GAP08259.1 Na+/melibiose symporter [Anaerolinea thermolimosa]HCE16429.1 MFS transporter [Anaerolinea thermolimosa]